MTTEELRTIELKKIERKRLANSPTNYNKRALLFTKKL